MNPRNSSCWGGSSRKALRVGPGVTECRAIPRMTTAFWFLQEDWMPEALAHLRKLSHLRFTSRNSGEARRRGVDGMTRACNTVGLQTG